MERIGLTTTVPLEIIYASGRIPVDLNNIFITSPRRAALVEEAETAGYPRNTCGWIKGLYSTVLNEGDIRRVVAVPQGDCSNTMALMETLQLRGIETIPFAYPFDRDRDMLRLQMEKLHARLGTTWEDSKACRDELRRIREKVHEIDRLTWERGSVSGFHNHYYQVSCSDMNGDPKAFEFEIDGFLDAARRAKPGGEEVRLGFIGVPPICGDVYDFVESLGARVVFNEVQRQFSMPFETSDLVEQYALYTYPYDVFARADDILREGRKREIHGVIHYVQSFCFRQIEDIIFREKLPWPIITVEGDKPGPTDARTRLRMESFVEMLV
jgi:benzoyl-CoA reductase/2-hydroxyglutaryl-CoA dehydratase subunit BcrC/BadD/HgdB